MTARIRCAAFTLLSTLALTTASFAQSSDVTFAVPVNLTKLSSSISKITIFCTIDSAALPPRGTAQNAPHLVQNQVDVPVSGGQVVTTVNVVVAVASLDLSKGTSATYACKLSGYSDRLKNYGLFSDNPPSTQAEFKVSPTPADLNGSFNW
jgi:uncharacterized protein YaaQ